MADSRVWLITGASRGMGVAFARAALAAMDSVVATGRRPDDVMRAIGPSDRLLVQKTGVEIPILGFGVYQIPPDDTEEAVATAFEVGYRHIDTTASYGNEEGVGRAIAAAASAAANCSSRPSCGIQTPGESKARAALEASLERLGLDHVDLYLIHQPFGDYYSFWRAMQQANQEELVRAIGVANFYPDRLIDLIDHNETTPAVDQVEVHPFFQRQADQDLMREHGVQLQSWGGFAEGKINLFTNPVLTGIGEDHGKSAAQVVLRWLIQRDIVTIPKSVRRERMQQNLDVFDFDLSADEMDRIAIHDTDTSQFFDHRDPKMVSWLNSRKNT